MFFLSTTVLFIPVVTALARAFQCPTGTTWLSTNLTCYGDIHIAVAVIAVCVLIAFTAISVAGTYSLLLPS